MIADFSDFSICLRSRTIAYELNFSMAEEGGDKALSETDKKMISIIFMHSFANLTYVVICDIIQTSLYQGKNK